MEQGLLERIVQEIAESTLVEEVAQARADYFSAMSDLREDDSSYEPLTNCFLNWFVLDRPLRGGTATPLQAFAGRPERSAEERLACIRLAGGVHSLFEVLRLLPGGIALRDLYTRESLQVTERRQVAGLKRGDLFEARLLPLADKLVFFPGAFVVHPRPAGEIIRRAVDTQRQEGRGSPADLIRRLEGLTFRFVDRYRERAPVERVYGEGLTSGPDPSRAV